MRHFQTSVVHATPSYLLHLHSALMSEDTDASPPSLRKAFIGAEPHRRKPAARSKRCLKSRPTTPTV